MFAKEIEEEFIFTLFPSIKFDDIEMMKLRQYVRPYLNQYYQECGLE